MNILGFVDINWDNILIPIGDMFLGNNNGLEGIFGADNQLVVGLFVFLVLFLMTLMMGLGMSVGSVIILPSLFAVFQWIPPLRITTAIISGLLLGFALHKIIKR